MKKNKMMRAASGLMVATLLTTSIISGTFAKYTTEDSGSDTARVAKWGLTVSASGNLFGKEYAKVDASSNGNSIVATGSDNTVKATDKNVVAPGTKNETGFTVSIKGTPEVAYNVTAARSDTVSEVKDIFLGTGDWGVMVEATGLNAASNVEGLYTESQGTYTKMTNGTWTPNTKYYELMNHVELTNKYYPIKWSVKAGGSASQIDASSDLTKIATDMNNNLTTAQANAPGIETAVSYTLTWEWPFNNYKDAEDTILGDLHENSSVNGTVVYATNSVLSSTEQSYSATIDKANYNLDINFGMTVTVTQVD